MAKQFPVTRFARGTKLTKQHFNTTPEQIQTAAANADLRDTQEHRGVFKVSWVIPWIGAAAAQKGDPIVSWPFLMPPFQQDFNRYTFQNPNYPIVLSEISVSIDQRAEPYAITGPYSLSNPGLLTSADMNRYDMVLSLLERQPSSQSGNTTQAEEIGRWEIDGVLAFGVQRNRQGGPDGSGVARANPLVISDQSLQIKPWNTYCWEIDCPGLYTTVSVDTWTCTVDAGPWNPGDEIKLELGPNSYTYITPDGNPDGFAYGIAAAAQYDPNFNVMRTDVAVVTVELKRAKVSALAVNTSVLIGAGTFTKVHTTTGKNPTAELLQLTSLHVCATFIAPLTERDKSSDFPSDNPLWPGIQNIPRIHEGQKTGTNIAFTPVIKNDLITGDDVQDGLHDFDLKLRERAPSGYGAGQGALQSQMQASLPPPTELLQKDAHYTVIAIPMWSGQIYESIRWQDLGVPDTDGKNRMGLPFQVAMDEENFAWEDIRAIPVPEGFVLHHAFAAWSGYSPPTTLIPGRSGYGTWLQKTQQVGIVINSGWKSDDYQNQQVAFLRWDGLPAPFSPDTYQNWMVDEYAPNAHARWRLLQIPLVNGLDVWDAHSWFSSGPPFYMGKANTLSKPRTYTGTMPSGFTGNVEFAAPLTGGKENMLVVRWQKQQDISGTLEPTVSDIDTCVVGQGGDWIILCGKQVLSA